MKTVKKSSQFKKDLKRYINNLSKIEKLRAVVELLANNKALPASYRMHKLTGQYKGCLECHIDGDFLLIWIDEDSETIYLVRLGSHSELFK
jgi:mRNA interferase YafQ